VSICNDQVLSSPRLSQEINERCCRQKARTAKAAIRARLLGSSPATPIRTPNTLEAIPS
jgi:hypothetical protein